MGLLTGVLHSTVYVASATSVSTRGQQTYEAVPRAVLAREERIDLTELLGPSGEAEAVDTVLLTEAEVKATDRIWLSGDSSADVTKARRVVRVEKVTTLDGQVSHYRTYV